MTAPDDESFGEPYGVELAEQVAEGLFRGFALVHVHRGFCGLGLFKDDRGVFACEVHDGLPGPSLARWGTQAELAAFLGAQSDRSMERAGGAAPGFGTDDPWRHGNQTVTRARLDEFVREVSAGRGRRSEDYVEQGPGDALVLVEVLDRVRLLRFLRDELNLNLVEASDMLKSLPVRVFGADDGPLTQEWIDRFAAAGGTCRVHRAQG